jgi:hypothetical protein
VGPGAGAEAHEGFFLRLTLGLGWHAWKKQLPVPPPDDSGLPLGGGEASASGVGLGLGIAIGYVVAPNLALHITGTGHVVGEPVLELGGMEIENKGSSLAAMLLGIGGTYYLMPMNVYVSASFGFGGMQFIPKEDIDPLDTDAGFAWELMAGKEWWVADDWGLGAALQFAMVNTPDEGERSAAFAVNALFSATYN